MAYEELGAGLTAASMAGTMLTKGPKDINVDYPEATPLEKQMAKMQFDAYLKIKEQVQDPTVLRDILDLLPSKNMAKEDLAKYEKEYQQTNAKLTQTAMEQANRAVGTDIKSLVDRGVISEEQGQQQLKVNSERINEMANIHFKKLESERLGRTRNDFISRSGQDMTSAGLIAKEQASGQNTMNAIVKNLLGQGQSEAGNRLNLASKVTTGNFNNAMSTYNARSGGLVDMSTNIINDYSKKQQQKKDNERIAEILRLASTNKG